MSILQCDVWVLKRCLFRNVNIAKSCLVIETGACTLKKVGGGGGDGIRVYGREEDST